VLCLVSFIRLCLPPVAASERLCFAGCPTASACVCPRVRPVGTSERNFTKLADDVVEATDKLSRL